MSNKNNSNDYIPLINIFIFTFILVGIADAAYLTYEHFANVIPPCVEIPFVDCGVVLKSKYAVLFGIPLAVLGLLHYLALGLLVAVTFYTEHKILKRLVFLQTAVGFLFSLYLVFLQIGVIKAICVYCMVSAIDSVILYFLVRKKFIDEYRILFLMKTRFGYQTVWKPLFFQIPPEVIHNVMVNIGNLISTIPPVKNIMAYLFHYDSSRLHQKVAGIFFERPVGLSAGFDYEAKLTQILPVVGFGFETIGTITHHSYGGNPSPMLGRLPKSRSLMVNKGYKNPGAKEVIKRLKDKTFAMPIGISIGQTNSSKIKTEQDAIDDIVKTFELFEKSNVGHSYYELNISCPNLHTEINFYVPQDLKKLLVAVEKLKIKKPIFIKMPIEKTNEEVKAMLDVIITFSVTGVIFGNLQKNRKDPAFDSQEVSQWNVGNFSGKPTEKRSNELIAFAYKHYHKKLFIIGTGGIFSAKDGYKKIRLGASLVQLITGMIYEGPQLIMEINRGVDELLKKDGFKNISEAIGVDSR